jgi:hypothetical protein
MPPASSAAHRFPQTCLVAAFVLTLLWGALYIGYGNAGVVDEPGQVEAAIHFAEKRPGVPELLPYLPGYHFGIILLSPGQPTLTSARLVTLGYALLGLAAFAAAWRRLHGAHPGPATLLLATFPVMFPFTAMAYTDVPAMALVLAGCWAHFSGWRASAALLLAGAGLIRQTSLVWAAYLVTVGLLDSFFPRGQPRPPWPAALLRWLEEQRWLLLLLATGAGLVLHAGRLTMGRSHGNQLVPNLATIHLAALAVLVLALPWWITRARAMLQSYRTARAAHPYLTPGLTALGLIGAALLAATYTNAHHWNRELFFDPPSTRTLLRNWPLVWIDRHLWLRLLSGLAVVVCFAGLGWLIARQRYARELGLILPFGAVLFLTNNLVEPRYLIPPGALALLWLEPGPGVLRLAGWSALLCLAQAPFLLPGLALW